MLVKSTVENIYRPIHELKPTITWGASTVGTLAAGVLTGMPMSAMLALSATSAVMTAVRGTQTKKLIDAKVALAGYPFWLLPANHLDPILARQPAHLWLGRGFRWTGKHTERALELNCQDTTMLLPPKWALKLFGKQTEFQDAKGELWIHGVEPNEAELFMPWEHSEGNWSIFGTTGAGKTRLYEVLCYQIVKRGDVLIVFDPKYDKDLRDTLIRVCTRAGRPNAFAEFHPAFPSRSVRLDPLANFSRQTEIASRISDIVGGGTPGDNFVAFIWRTLDAITGGLLYVDEKPSLKRLRYYAEAGPEELVESCLKRFLNEWNPGAWEDHVNTLTSALTQKGGKVQTRLKTGTSRQQAMVEIYHANVPQSLKRDDLNALISLAEHSREHYGKMIAGLLPLLTQLTAGDLGDLLSPNYADPSDKREILDMQKVIRGKRVLYVATDSLSDSTVGSAIAAILLSDLRAVAGARYNYGMVDKDGNEDKSKIHIICDEAAELVTAPLISIMNKGRGAGFIAYLATQNFSDYIHRFGSEDAARMVVGNGNNRLSLRVVDPKTQQYMVESFGEVNVKQSSASVSARADTETVGMEFGGGRQTSVQTVAKELFPGYLLSKLPDLHFVAAISGGKVFKGRLPKLVH